MQRMEATHIQIGNLFHDRTPFVVPPYQRAYAWDKEEIDDFIEDIETVYKNRIEKISQQHFFGGIVSIMYSSEDSVGRKYDVVDGQQRLATFIILFSIIINENRKLEKQAKSKKDNVLAELVKERADVIEKEYLKHRFESKGKHQTSLRLVLSRNDKEYFDQFIEKLLTGVEQKADESSPASHRRLLNAANSIRKHLVNKVLKDCDLKTKAEHLLVLFEALRDDCEVIHIVTGSKDEAYRLFQVLNDRGKGLTEGDLLRATTLEILDKDGIDLSTADKSWDEILKGKPEQTEQFLRAYYGSHVGKRAGRRTLYDNFKEQFIDRIKKPDEICTLVMTLNDEISVYRKLTEPEWPYETEKSITAWDRDRLTILISVFKHTLCLPLLLSAARKLQESTFSEIIQLLERFTFRYVSICGGHKGKLNDLYIKQAFDMRRNSKTYKSSTLNKALIKLQEEDKASQLFKASLQKKLVYNVKATNILKYFLIAIEQFRPWVDAGGKGTPYCKEKAQVLDVSQIQIEHIYPQHPDKTNVNEDLESKKHFLGNLSFWGPSDNGSAGNKMFPEKRKLYKASNIRLTRELEEFDHWDVSALEVRENKLIEYAEAIFTLK